MWGTPLTGDVGSLRGNKKTSSWLLNITAYNAHTLFPAKRLSSKIPEEVTDVFAIKLHHCRRRFSTLNAQAHVSVALLFSVDMCTCAYTSYTVLGTMVPIFKTLHLPYTAACTTRPWGGFPSSISRQPRECQYRPMRLRKALDNRESANTDRYVFGKLSTTERVPIPTDTSSESSRRDDSNADLFGTDTILQL